MSATETAVSPETAAAFFRVLARRGLLPDTPQERDDFVAAATRGDAEWRLDGVYKYRTCDAYERARWGRVACVTASTYGDDPRQETARAITDEMLAATSSR